MKAENILYTDGHDVTVTDSSFKVKNSLYQLRGITNHAFRIIRPKRFPVVLVILLGVIMTVLGVSQLIPETFMPNVKLFSIALTANALATALGLLIFIIGSVAVGLMKDRYAIRIATAEAEKNVIVSDKKEYISSIMNALNHAFINLVSATGKKSMQH